MINKFAGMKFSAKKRFIILPEMLLNGDIKKSRRRIV